VSVPSTSKRTTVFLIARSARAGITVAAAVGPDIVSCVWKSVKLCSRSQQCKVEDRSYIVRCQHSRASMLPMDRICVLNGSQLFSSILSHVVRVSAMKRSMSLYRLVGGEFVGTSKFLFLAVSSESNAGPCSSSSATWDERICPARYRTRDTHVKDIGWCRTLQTDDSGYICALGHCESACWNGKMFVRANRVLYSVASSSASVAIDASYIKTDIYRRLSSLRPCQQYSYPCCYMLSHPSISLQRLQCLCNILYHPSSSTGRRCRISITLPIIWSAIPVSGWIKCFRMSRDLPMRDRQQVADPTPTHRTAPHHLSPERQKSATAIRWSCL